MSELKYSHIYHTMNAITPIPTEEWLHLVPHFYNSTVRKGDLIEKAGRVAKDLHIIISGSVRLFYLTDDGRDFNHAFKFENDLFASYASILSSTPSTFSIETMEETIIISIPFVILQEAFNRHHAWERLGRLIAESHYLTKEHREYQFLIKTAEERYRSLVLTNENLKNRVPQYHLATYLGINPSSLNRIIKKIKSEKQV